MNNTIKYPFVLLLMVLPLLASCSYDEHIDTYNVEVRLSQSVDDGWEGTADDNAHCHVQHIAAHGKCLELFKELFDAAFFLFHR